MNTKTQELVTAGYALAKGLDAESAKLVKELADELAVQRVRADELNKQVVNLAVENSTIKTMNDCLAEELRGYESDGAFDGPDMNKLWYSHAGALPATDAAIARLQAQYRAEGIHFMANRLLAAWEHGFIDSPDKEVIDVARMILSAVEMLPDATEGDFDRAFSDEMMAVLADEMRKGAGNV